MFSRTNLAKTHFSEFWMKIIVTPATRNTRGARDKTQSRLGLMSSLSRPLSGYVGRTQALPNVNTTKGFSSMTRYRRME